MLLSELLATPQLGLQFLHEASGSLDRRVGRPVTTDLLTPGRYLTGGELLITGLVWRRSPEDSETFVAEASPRDRTARGLTSLAEPEQNELTEISTAYHERFEFPLVVSLRDADSFDQILAQSHRRLRNSESQEHAAALIEIAEIAGYRFDDYLHEANPIHSTRTRWTSKR